MSDLLPPSAAPRSATSAHPLTPGASAMGEYDRRGSSRPAPSGRGETYPLAPMQLGMLFHWLRDPAGGVDLEQITCTLDGVDVSLLVRAWEQVMRRHALLRTVFRWQGVDVPMQEVLDDVPLLVRDEDLRALDDDARRRHIDEYIGADRARGFDFAAPPLFRLAFFRTADDRHEMLWTFPHILLDGRSFVIIVRELIATYQALESGQAPALEDARPFADFVAWLQGRDPQPATAYWKKLLDGFSEPVYPEVAGAPGNPPAEYAEQSVWLSRDETEAMRAFVKDRGITLNTMVQGAFALLLSRYSGADDVVFGATRACRRTALDGDPAVSEMTGLFINTLPVRVRIRPDEPVIEWLRRIRADQVEVRDWEHTSLMQVQEASAVPQGVGLFDTMLVFENQQQATAFNAFDARFSKFRLREKTTFPLTLHGYGEAELMLRFEYYCDKFSDAAVARMLGHLANLLREMMVKGDGPASALVMLSPDERAQLAAWNATDDDSITAAATLTQLLEEGAALNPDAIALECGAESMTYRELHARAAALARVLVARGVRPGVLVGVCMERSFEMMVALLGILKSGGAYVPLDPDYPAERLAFMLSDASCPVLLTQQRIAEGALKGVATSDAELLCVDSEWSRIEAESRDAAAPAGSGPDDLAYMIYTSGSTGKPKGAMNRHRGIVNLLRWMRREYALDARDAVLQKTPISFDLSVPELFLPLISGARLVIAEPGAHRDPASLAKVMRDHGVTVTYTVPSMLREFLGDDAPALPDTLRNVTCSGEALPFDVQEGLFARKADVRLYNLYGPTEAAVEATYWVCKPGDARQMVPVGRPVANTRIHILDAAMQHVPAGVSGELYIAGVQVGAGYHNRAELTAERFIADPFSPKAGARMYRTGDRARWLDDGTIEYLGRLDFQVKLRGFRIEVGEIEAVLAADPAVRTCAVLLRNDPGIEARLVAYYVPEPGAPTTSDALRARLDTLLPSYMVPWLYVPVDAMPLSPSGKLDRKALPAPEGVLPRAAAVSPRNDVEARVLAIWEHVLNKKGIGVTERFNEVGGNSLAAVRVFSRIEREFEQKLQLVTMLRHDTVEKIAVLLREPARADEWSCIVPFATVADGVPVFCPHAQTGNVLIYQHFAKEIGAHHPVYGIQAYGNWGEQDPHESMDEMIRFYVDEIVKVRPHGPYIFMGGSLGGYIALELARAMRARGEEVRMLAMYDTVGPDYPHYSLFGRIAKFVKSHGGFPLWRVRSVFHAGKEKLTPRLVYWNLRKTLRWWYENTRRDYLYWKYEDANPPRDFAMPANLTRVRLASRRMLRGYRAEPYPGKITYFRADIQPTGAIHDPVNGWSGLAEEFEVHPVPAGHTGGMSYPVVVGLSKTFLECAKRAAVEARAPRG